MTQKWRIGGALFTVITYLSSPCCYQIMLPSCQRYNQIYTWGYEGLFLEIIMAEGESATYNIYNIDLIV